MDLILVDDSKQRKPSRPGMGDLVAVGGLRVPSGSVKALMPTLDETCTEYGFPSCKDEFKVVAGAARLDAQEPRQYRPGRVLRRPQDGPTSTRRPMIARSRRSPAAKAWFHSSPCPRPDRQ